MFFSIHSLTEAMNFQSKVLVAINRKNSVLHLRYYYKPGGAKHDL